MLYSNKPEEVTNKQISPNKEVSVELTEHKGVPLVIKENVQYQK